MTHEMTAATGEPRRVRTSVWGSSARSARGGDERHEPIAKRALVLPGIGYTVAMPLLHYTCMVLDQAGFHVQVIDWELRGMYREDFPAFVADAALDAASAAPEAGTTLVVGKSLGTLAAPWAAERGYPGIWLTPLLDEPEVAAALADYPAPSLVVGGTADTGHWRGDADIAGTRVEIDGGGHSLQVEDDWRASLDALRTTADAIDTFARDLG